MNFSLAGKTALITGGGSGIGRASCELFFEQGAGVAILDINAAAAQATTHDIQSKGGNAFAWRCDITDRTAVDQTVGEIADRFGGVDILVCCAGGTFGAAAADLLEDVTDEDFDRITRLNLYSTFYLSRAVVPLMKKRHGGRIIVVSSGAGRMFSRSRYGRIPYAASKSGQIGLVRQMAKDLGSFGITVNSVAPGLVLSSDYFKSDWEQSSEQSKTDYCRSVPLGRLGEPRDIAAAIAFLAADEAGFITGHCIDVNGGRFMF